MRLIDADKLIEEFRDNTIIGNAMRILVDMQPTAYDVDKVVEELRIAREDYCNDEQYDVSYGFKVAIEIVKAGLKND